MLGIIHSSPMPFQLLVQAGQVDFREMFCDACQRRWLSIGDMYACCTSAVSRPLVDTNLITCCRLLLRDPGKLDIPEVACVAIGNLPLRQLSCPGSQRTKRPRHIAPIAKTHIDRDLAEIRDAARERQHGGLHLRVADLAILQDSLLKVADVLIRWLAESGRASPDKNEDGEKSRR